jgi:hypothetical protein
VHYESRIVAVDYCDSNLQKPSSLVNMILMQRTAAVNGSSAQRQRTTAMHSGSAQRQLTAAAHSGS